MNGFLINSRFFLSPPEREEWENAFGKSSVTTKSLGSDFSSSSNYVLINLFLFLLYLLNVISQILDPNNSKSLLQRLNTSVASL